MHTSSDRRAMVIGSRTAVFVVSADYERRTGGWVYNTRMLSELRRRGWYIRDVITPPGFPAPDSAVVAETAALISALPDRTLVLSDQLITSVLPDLMLAHATRLLLVPIVHHPLALELSRGAATLETIAQQEKRALSGAHRVITTSSATAGILARDYEVARERLIVARPGFDRFPASEGSDGQLPLLLALGAVIPRKDYGTLIGAMAGLRERRWRLVIVGSTTRAPDHVAALQQQIISNDLADRVHLAGELDEDELGRLWSQADLFVSSSAHEGFGMAVGEAVARGIPVVTTEAGAVTEWLSRRAGIVVGVGDVDALRASIARLLDDPAYRQELRAGAIEVRDDLPSWADSGGIVDRALSQVT